MTKELRLKNKGDRPATGWVFEDSRTEWRGEAPTFRRLVGLVMDHRLANDLPVGTWEETAVEIERQLCEKLGPEKCYRKRGAGDGIVPTVRTIGWHDVKNFLSMAAGWFAQGVRAIPQAEAEQRAQVCVECPYNVNASGCMGCMNIASQLSAVLKGRSTSHDPALRNCGVCGCSNKAQVHIPLEALAKGVTPGSVFPDWCWKKEAAAKVSTQP